MKNNHQRLEHDEKEVTRIDTSFRNHGTIYAAWLYLTTSALPGTWKAGIQHSRSLDSVMSTRIALWGPPQATDM